MTCSRKIAACLWFDHQGEAAAAFHVSLLPNSRITSVLRHGPGSTMPEGTALLVNLEPAGAGFMALHGGPRFSQSQAVPVVVKCGTQAESGAMRSKLAVDCGGDEPGDSRYRRARKSLSWQLEEETE